MRPIMADYFFRALLIALCVLVFGQLCISAPLDQFYPGDHAELTDPQRLQLLKELRDMIPLEAAEKESEAAKRFNLGSTDNGGETGLWRIMPQKRFRPFRTQTRAGGVALCLWKVCPAAPWLVSRRR